MSSPHRPSRRPVRSDSLELLNALDEVYRDTDHTLSGWSCPASTECCRFGITGREPYVTSVEAAVIRRAIAARGGPRSWRRAGAARVNPEETSVEQRNSSLRGANRLVGVDGTGRVSLPIIADERRCPLLTEEGSCAVYAARPLGCRTFFCDRAVPGSRVRHHEINALVRRIQDIAARHQVDGDRGRPLTRILAEL